MAFVISVLTLVVVAAGWGLRLPLVLLAAGYALAVPVFGMTHARLLPGPAHWIIQVAHLLVGFGAMIVGAKLGEFIEARSRNRSDLVSPDQSKFRSFSSPPA